MEERKNPSHYQRFEQYQPSKTALLWSCAGSVVVALVVGFTWGGWVTGGSAQSMAQQSAAQARQEVAAVVCIDRFMAATDMRAQLTALKGMDRSYQRGKFVEDGGWAILPVSGGAEPIMPVSSSSDQRKAAGLCAEELAKRDIPVAGTAAGAAEPISDTTTIAQ